MSTEPDVPEPLDAAIARLLSGRGRLIDAAWVKWSAMLTRDPVYLPMASEAMRDAFFAGAYELLKITSSFDGDEEPTEDDVRRFALVNKELHAFLNDFALRRLPASGSA